MTFPKQLRFLVILLLVVGICFRFVNLDLKSISFDESYTLLRSTGHTEAQMFQDIVNEQVIGREDLMKYQRMDLSRTTADVVTSLAKEEPQLPPFYFVLTHWGMQLQDSIAVARGLSVLFGLLVLPAAYWLAWELFGSSIVSLITTALIALSPAHVVYAQEARPYTLWIFLTLVSSAALLRALRYPSNRHWWLYRLTLVVGAYSYLYFGLVLVAHSIYCLFTQKLQWNQSIRRFAVSLLMWGFALASWVGFAVYNNFSPRHIAGFFNNTVSLQHLINRWVINITRVFLDYGLGYPKFDIPYHVPFALTALLLSGYALYYLWTHTEKKTSLLILSLIGVQVVMLMLPDLILRRYRFSGETRYLFLIYLGIQFAIAYLFTKKIASASKPGWRSIVWQAALIGVLLAGVFSGAASSQAPYWWNKTIPINPQQTAAIVGRTAQPLVVSNTPFPNVLIALSYALDPKTKFLLAKPGTAPKIPENFTEVFLYDAYEPLLSDVQKQGYKLETFPLTEEYSYYRLVKQ
ncbi:glycosyltransferase family 39 protein [Cyanobacteria bacterium FACHB-63]|nr:glycosyltransferase family 39 protein [Cyanobacteria bacterium FACHB-63]